MLLHAPAVPPKSYCKLRPGQPSDSGSEGATSYLGNLLLIEQSNIDTKRLSMS